MHMVRTTSALIYYQSFTNGVHPMCISRALCVTLSSVSTVYDLVILTTFGHLTGEETGMNFGRILVIVARYVHTVSLNIIIMTIRYSTQKMLILSK